MFSPAISPHDGKVMMINCDMSAAYITLDDGLNWRMIHCSQLHSTTVCRPAFHPDGKTIFAASGGEGLKVSHDLGVHFEPTGGNLPHDLFGEIAIDPGSPEHMLVGTAKKGKGGGGGGEVWLSVDGGKAWKKCNGPAGRAVGFHFDQTSGHRTWFAATEEGIWRSDDGGNTWAAKDAGLPWKVVKAFSGGSDAVSGKVMLYCSIEGRDEGGKYGGGVYRSSDRGQTWQSAMVPPINMDTGPADEFVKKRDDKKGIAGACQYPRVLTTDGKPMTVWAFNLNTGIRPPHHSAAYRSDDGGKTWRVTFIPDPRFEGCNTEISYMTASDGQFYQGRSETIAIDPHNPDHVLQGEGGEIYITDDGGKKWACRHMTLTGAKDPKDPNASWLCTGPVVTSTWNFYVDPFEPNRRYICYTDIGFARSVDAGKSWKWWGLEGRPKWHNSCFELAFDPKTPGKIWGAFSNVHDIPNNNIISGHHKDNGPGGIFVSTDFTVTWQISNNGLPEAACTSVVVDPKSPPGARTLYCSIFNNGVYKSIDDGKNWKLASQGLGSPEDMRACRLQLHADGTLFVLITAKLSEGGGYVAHGPGIYKSTDGAASWELVNKSEPFLWPKDFSVDAKDSRHIVVGTANAGKTEGGLWSTTDGGATWTKLAQKGPETFGGYFSPFNAGWIYMTLTEGAPGCGLWLSKDSGHTWSAMNGLPFRNAQRVAFDPADPSVIYVTTFGGSVWRGPASE
jgi:photosystem II stability/assembly factor-like uncharacterized protein